MVLIEKCCCFFRLTTGGMILGWLGAVESLVVIILSIFGLVKVDMIMEHLRNETESFTAQSINETHLSIFRRNRGEMTEGDAMIIERGDKRSDSLMQLCDLRNFSIFRDVCGANTELNRQLRYLDFISPAYNRCN